MPSVGSMIQVGEVTMAVKRTLWALAMQREIWSLALFIFIGSIYFLPRTQIFRSSVVDSSMQLSIPLGINEMCLTIYWPNPRYCTISEKSKLQFGTSFNLSSAYLKDLGIPLRDFVPVRRETVDDFVFATAANKAYFHVAMDAIGNVQKFLPNHTIYFYDLDLSRSQKHINKIKRIRSLCNVIYRKFNFSRYPSHVQILKTYAFKPLILHEMLSEFPRVFWIDSSIRFKTRNLSLTLDEVYKSGGILTFEPSIHSNFEAIHKGMYRYLPISASAAADTVQYGANSIYLHRSEEMYTRIISWWVLCALREDCIAPTRNLTCNFKKSDVWAGCHRFDQAALNILMANHFRYKVSRYTSRQDHVDVRRYRAHEELLVVCPTGIRIKSAEYFT